MYLDTATGNEINLAKILKHKKTLDIEVCLNNNDKTIVRLMAEPVNKIIANERRRKAKIEMKGHNPSKEILFLMSWTIFITTIPKEDADFSKIMSIYRLRWKIETIFKTWKSNMHFAKVHNVSKNQLVVLLTSRLIMIVVCTHLLLNRCSHYIRKYYNQELSMIKFFNYLRKNMEKFFALLSSLRKIIDGKRRILDSIAKYCSYDKRKRLNMRQLTLTALLS